MVMFWILDSSRIVKFGNNIAKTYQIEFIFKSDLAWEVNGVGSNCVEMMLYVVRTCFHIHLFFSFNNFFVFDTIFNQNLFKLRIYKHCIDEWNEPSIVNNAKICKKVCILCGTSDATISYFR